MDLKGAASLIEKTSVIEEILNKVCLTLGGERTF